MRLLHRLTFLCGLLALLATAGTAIADSRRTLAAQQQQVISKSVSQETARLNEYFARSAAVVRQLAENPAFRAFYNDPRPRAEKSRDPRLMSEINRALVFLQSLHHFSISEACFIDRSGGENARVVRGVVAPALELSDDEASNAFFSAALKLAVGTVYQSAPYRSGDTEEWVLANATRVPVSGRDAAIVHFEVTLDSFRSSDTGDSRIRIVDQTGLVLVDSESPVHNEAFLGYPEQGDFGREVAKRVASGSFESGRVGDEMLAVRQLSTGLETPNVWFVVGSTSAAVGIVGRLSSSTVVLFGVEITMLGLAMIGFRMHQRRLILAATTDALTGLPNRTLFAERATEALKLAARGPHTAAILLLDLNRFKEVNDTLGHHSGDQLLCEIAHRLALVLRASDTLARLGGDEFAILLPNTNGLLGAMETAERIATALSAEVTLGDISVRTDACVGIALFPDHASDPSTLLQRADVAMYRAKHERIPYSVYSAENDPHSTERLSLIGELRQAIANDELSVFYQPKFTMAGKRLVGAEALVRWHHPRLGLLAPADFLPIVEVCGLLRPLTNAVMGMAFAQAADWRALGHDLSIAVNVSPRSLGDPTFLGDLRTAVDQSGLDPIAILIEITEDSLIADPESSRSSLDEMSKLGVGISVDDYGTGYSSLSYLRSLPVDELKIDRSFISAITNSSIDRVIVQSTIDLAHELGYVVVAEGVETQSQAQILLEMGCDMAQGFLLGRPTSADDFTSQHITPFGTADGVSLPFSVSS